MISTKLKLSADTQIIRGPAGDLEILLSDPTEKPRGCLGIICHPHPLHGGTMHNKVVTVLAKAFLNLGVNTVRFNFRGVGRSQGVFDQGMGELEDLLAVIDWLQRERPQRELWLGGFSFGASIAAKAATQIPVNKLVTIAPPVAHFAMQNLPAITARWVLVQGEQDDVVPAKEVLDWAATRDPQPIIIKFPEAGHFFHGQLVELRTAIEEALVD